MGPISLIATLVINLISTVLHCQYTAFEGTIWKAICGIGTGLACGAQLANICMDDFDKFVQEAPSPYGRYIDDCICILPPDRVSQFLIRANAWHPSISVEQAAVGLSDAPYLDITMSLNPANQCTFELYRCCWFRSLFKS